jgi:hypothetical protein
VSPHGGPHIDLTKKTALEKAVAVAERNLLTTGDKINQSKQLIKRHQQTIDSNPPKSQGRPARSAPSGAIGSGNGSNKPDTGHRMDTSFASRPDISRAGGSFNPSVDSSGRDTCWT